jgi:hypothetical protein
MRSFRLALIACFALGLLAQSAQAFSEENTRSQTAAARFADPEDEAQVAFHLKDGGEPATMTDRPVLDSPALATSGAPDTILYRKDPRPSCVHNDTCRW